MSGFELDNQDLQNALSGLKQLPDKLKNDTLVKIFRRTARPLVNLAKSNAPKNKSGKKSNNKKTAPLSRTIGTKKGRNKSGVKPTLIIGPMLRRGGYHGHLLEAGTKARKTKSGAYRGRGPATRYMAKTKVQQGGQVADKTVKSIIKLIDKTLAKHGYKTV